MSVHTRSVGDHLKDWRRRRRLSQLDLATEARISARHLSFVETGRSAPSREMTLHLAEQLQIPMRERNVLLVAAGYAPMFPERSLDDPALALVREAIDIVLQGHKPYPAFAIDRHWNLIGSNDALPIASQRTCAVDCKSRRVAIAPFASSRATDRTYCRSQVGGIAARSLGVHDSTGTRPGAQSPARLGRRAIAYPYAVGRSILHFDDHGVRHAGGYHVVGTKLAIETFFPADHETIAIVRALSA